MRATVRWAAMVAVVVAGASAVALGADWPQFRGPKADGFSPETGINKNWAQQQPKVLWKITLTDQGFAGPSVADGNLFIIDHAGKQDIVRAIDVQTGKDVWRFTYDDASGANYGFARSTPVFDNGKLYTLSRLGNLHCLDAKTGKKLWNKDIIVEFGGKRPGWDLAGSPVIDGEKLIVCPGGANAAVAALNKNTGATIWKGGGSSMAGYSTPVIATIGGTKQYVLFLAEGLVGVNAANGQRLWSFPWKTSYDVNAAQPLVMGNKVFISTGYGKGCALIEVSGGQAKPLWQNKEIQEHFSSAVVFKGHIYGTTDPGDLVCLDPQTGKSLWRHRGFEKGGLVAVDGTVIAMDGAKGDVVMVALDSSAYRELGRIKPLGGQSWTQPIVADGKLFIRNTKELACLALR